MSATSSLDGWWAAFAAALLAHLVVVGAHAVDLPYRDEWELLAPDALPRGLTLEWVLAPHNEHRAVLPKLQVWLLLQLDGWDNRTYVVSSGLLFGASLVALLAWLARRGLPRAACAALGLLLLSPIGCQNHVSGYHAQLHLALLGLFLAAPLLSSRRPRDRALGIAALALAAFSFAAGVAYGAALLAMFVAREEVRRRRGQVEPGDRRSALAVLVAGGAVLVAWAAGWPGGGLTPGSPFAWRTWDVLLNLVSFGFGLQTISAALGFACLLLVLVPVAAGLVRRVDEDEAWELAAVALALLAGLATVAVGRAAYGPFYAKTSRYAELGLPLVGVAALAWWRLLPDRPRARAAALAVVLGVAAAGLADDWSLEGYRQVERDKRSALATIAAHREGRLRAPEVYPGDLAEKVEAARRLGVSFTAPR